MKIKDIIKLRDIIYERFGDYKEPSLFLCSSSCDWKCCKDNPKICQNMAIAKQPSADICIEKIYKKYISNNITKAIVIGGLEPMLQSDEVISLIKYFRKQGCNDYFVIYTGYYEDEISDIVAELKNFKNIIIKYGRYTPDIRSRFDPILGVTLSSENQYAEIIS